MLQSNFCLDCRRRSPEDTRAVHRQPWTAPGCSPWFEVAVHGSSQLGKEIMQPDETQGNSAQLGKVVQSMVSELLQSNFCLDCKRRSPEDTRAVHGQPWTAPGCGPACQDLAVQVTKAQKAQSTYSECSPPILDAVHPFAAELTFLSLADHLARICGPKDFSCSPPAQARYRLLQARYRMDCSENHGLHKKTELPSCRVGF